MCLLSLWSTLSKSLHAAACTKPLHTMSVVYTPLTMSVPRGSRSRSRDQAYISLVVKVDYWSDPRWSLEMLVNACATTVGQIKDYCRTTIRLNPGPGFDLDLHWVIEPGHFYSLQDHRTLNSYMRGEGLDPSTVPDNVVFCLSACISSSVQVDPPLPNMTAARADWLGFRNIVPRYANVGIALQYATNGELLSEISRRMN